MSEVPMQTAHPGQGELELGSLLWQPATTLIEIQREDRATGTAQELIAFKVSR